MPHPLAWRSRRAADETGDGLLEFAANVFGRLFLGRAPDFSDHDHAMRLGVAVTGLEDVDEIGAVDRIAADPHASALPHAEPGQLVDGFVGQGTGTRDHADVARLVDVTGHDADLALAGSDD